MSRFTEVKLANKKAFDREVKALSITKLQVEQAIDWLQRLPNQEYPPSWAKSLSGPAWCHIRDQAIDNMVAEYLKAKGIA